MIALLSLVLALQDPAADERLRKAADQAEAELKEFRARAAEEEKRQEQALVELRKAVLAEAKAVVALHEAVGPLRPKLDAERRERGVLAAKLEEAKDFAARAADLARSLRSDVEDLRAARVLPPSDALPAPSADSAAEIDAMSAALLAAVKDAGALEKGTREITGPDGRTRKVELLRAGAVFAAYRDPASGAVGVSVKGPDGSGHRWTEALSPDEKAWIVAATSAASGTVRVPVDVAQALTIDASMADKSFTAFLKSGGPVMIPLGIVALLSLVLCLERFRFYARAGAHREAGVAEVLRCAKQSSFAEAEQRAASMSGVVSRALSACLAARHQGRAAMENALQETMLHESPKLERFLPLLAVLAGVAPMLGLLGTVAGIIATFEVISVIGRGDPALMAGGISEALVATGTGLFVAIPLLVLHSYFAGRVERIVGDAERHGASLINGVAEETEAVDARRDR